MKYRVVFSNNEKPILVEQYDTYQEAERRKFYYCGGFYCRIENVESD